MDAGFKPLCLNTNLKTQQLYYTFERTKELIYFKDNVYQTVRDKY